MPEIILKNSNKSSQIITRTEKKPAPAKWFAEGVLMSQLWTEWGLRLGLKEKVKVERGRMGVYEVIDFVLVMLCYSISQELNLKDFFNKVKDFKSAIAALWQREQSPSQSALSRFLGDVRKENVEQMRKMLFEDMLYNGIKTEHIGGVYDRTNTQHIFFDIDATKDAARQRSVVKTEDYPKVRRRRKNYAPGYSGRKRGEVVRSRATVQQSHTQEWLGSFGSAGNGEHFSELEKCCKLMKEYMKAHLLDSQQAIARLDGQYGWARGAYICKQEEVGYLMRCSDYRLIESPEVKEAIAQAQRQNFYQVDTATLREIVDCGFIEWKACSDKTFTSQSRLIVAISNAPKDLTKVAVGKVKLDKVYELFVTDRSSEQFSATDILSLYFGRAGFEQTLSQEDSENDPDRFCSQHQSGQEFFQLICLWVWNARLRLGFISNDAQVRRTLWTTSPSVQSQSQTQAQTQAQTQTQTQAQAQTQAQTQTQTQILSVKKEQKVEPSKEINKKLGLAEPTIHPIYWDDLEACSLRRFLPNILESQHFEIIFPEKVLQKTPTPSILSRDQRAHRRLSWSLRFKRNCSICDSAWRFYIFGLPIKLSSYLSNISSKAA